MATIINTPSSRETTDSSLGLILGVIIAVALVILFFVYGLPALRQSTNNNTPGGANINVTLPGGGTGGTGSGNTGGTGGNGGSSSAY